MKLPQEITDLILIQSENLNLARKLKNDYAIKEIIKTLLLQV
jgi:hypothetical protein